MREMTRLNEFPELSGISAGVSARFSARWLAIAALCLILMGLMSACAGRGDRRDLVTDSDETEIDRRARVRMELASAYFSRGQMTTALDEVKMALQVRPQSSEALNLRGLIYAAMEENSLAEDSFRRSLDINPQDGDAIHNFGWFLCQQRRFSEAQALFKQVVTLPNYRQVVRSLLAQGVCEARNSQWAEAEKTLSKAFELEPGNPTVSVNFAEVLFRRGDYERARFYIRRVNSQEDFVSAQSLWLAIRIENRLGQSALMRNLGQQMSQRFPKAPETLLYEKGRFNE